MNVEVLSLRREVMGQSRREEELASHDPEHRVASATRDLAISNAPEAPHFHLLDDLNIRAKNTWIGVKNCPVACA